MEDHALNQESGQEVTGETSQDFVFPLLQSPFSIFYCSPLLHSQCRGSSGQLQDMCKLSFS